MNLVSFGLNRKVDAPNLHLFSFCEVTPIILIIPRVADSLKEVSEKFS